MHMFKVFLAYGLVGFSLAAFGEAIDVDGNPVVPETDLGDIDTDATTVGDLRDVMTPGYAAVSNAAMNAGTAATNYTDAVARTPHLYTVGEGATYQWGGSSAFPAGKYYRVNTGEGRLGYAAKVPVPVGQIIVTGDADDPMIEKFGSLFPVDSSNLALSSISGFVEDGCYSVADFSYEIYPGSGIKAYLHSNIIAGSAELTSVSGNYSFTFDTDDGITHYAYFINGWTWGSGGYTTTYQHEWYDPDSGYWDSENRAITVGYATASPTDYAFSMFGGTDIATMENIDTARSQLKERRGRYGELGDGWGYKVYDFTNDERYWELKVPRLTVAVENQIKSDGNSRYICFASRIWNPDSIPDDSIDGVYYFEPRCEFLPQGYEASIKKIISTSGKYSADSCRIVNYRLGFLPRDPTLGEYEAPCDFGVTMCATNIAISTSGQPYLWGGIEFENTNEPGPGEHAGEVKDFSLSWKTNFTGTIWREGSGAIRPAPLYYTYGGVTYTNNIPCEVTYTLTGFRPTVTYSGYTATVVISFSVSTVCELVYPTASGWKKWENHYRTYSKESTISVTLKTASALDTLTEHANHVITDYNQHMIWDDGLKCTWQLCVTNGVFSVRKVSNLDYREKEFIE